MQSLLPRLCLAISRWLLSSDIEKIETTLRFTRLQPSVFPACPLSAIRALIAAEDRRFFYHVGFDAVAMLRALWAYASRRYVSGASTIEQQLVRTVRRRYERTLGRKISEIMLACSIQALASKAEIASLYLNVAYFGWRMNGFRQAIRRMSMSVEGLSNEEAAYIVAMLKYPLPRIPSAGRLKLLRQRQNYILKHIDAIGSSRPHHCF